MPKRIPPLSDQKIKRTKPQQKQIAHFDGGGMFLLVTPSGGKLWRFKYRFEGKEKILAFGSYPEISLADAREKREAARAQVAKGIDPANIKRAQKLSKDQGENSFEVVAREWHEKFSSRWSPGHAERLLYRLEKEVFPWIGSRPIGEIKAPEVLAIMRRIESRGTLDTAKRVKILCGQAIRYAVATGRAERDPTADLKGALPPIIKSHLAAVTDPKEVADLLRVMDSYQGSFVVRCALQLAPLVFVRPGELRQAEWSEINLNTAEWNIPANRMKMKQAHLVPLSRQALDILRGLKQVTGDGRYLFPSIRSSARPMSDNTILGALRRMGYSKDEMTGHGFRAMARTILDEVLQVRPDFIEHQLAHAVRDPNGRAYNRTAHLAERTMMMQQWSDYLDDLKAGGKIFPFAKKAG